MVEWVNHFHNHFVVVTCRSVSDKLINHYYLTTFKCVHDSGSISLGLEGIIKF